MSGPEAREEAIKSLVAAQAHLGTKNVDSQVRRTARLSLCSGTSITQYALRLQMREYVWRRRTDGIHVLDVSTLFPD
jgi:ribosomal protein S2